MKRSLVFLATASVIAWSQIAIARQGAVSAEIMNKAQAQGAARVIVRLDVSTTVEGFLAAPAVTEQREAISAAQANLIKDLSATSHRVTGQFETIPFLALEIAPEALAVLEQSPAVLGVTEDHVAVAFLAESVPLVEADQAWANGFDGTGWTVAILDTGVDGAHPFLTGKVVEEACFSGNGNCPDGSTMQIGPGAAAPCTYATEECMHGTHVAGIAAGDGQSLFGFSGVAKGASLITIQVFSRLTGPACIDAGEDPCAGSYQADQVRGLERVFALRGSRQIGSVNMSLGGERFTDQAACDAANPAVKAAIDNLRSVGIVTAIASGNSGFTDGMSAPGCVSSAVSVGSTTKTDLVSSFSNSVSFLSLLAPGESINSSIPGGGFGVMSGTSQATPHVAGAWAILKQKSPTATVLQVVTALRSTALPIQDLRNGLTGCRIRIFRALDKLGSSASETITDISVPGSQSTTAGGINDCGQNVVGYFQAAAPPYIHGFLWSAGSFTTLDVPGAGSTYAWGINNAGQIAGHFVDDTQHRRAFLLSGGSFTTIDVPGSLATEARAINNAGQIVGIFETATGRHGFLWSGGGFTTIDFPGLTPWQSTWPSGINDAGQIVGFFSDSVDPTSHGFIWTQGTFTRIDASGINTSLGGINNSGLIVGASTQGYFLWCRGTFTPTVLGARAINDSGDILGNSSTRGFLRSGGSLPPCP